MLVLKTYSNGNAKDFMKPMGDILPATTTATIIPRKNLELRIVNVIKIANVQKGRGGSN